MMYVTCGSSVYRHDIYGREAPSSHSSSLASDNHSSLTASLYPLPMAACSSRRPWRKFTSADNGQSAAHDHARRTYEQI
ncbi:hypothetical protein I3760_13G141000 [Carya illinoinensis]|nr:hypothetical protein I3760_13G141000 [Carya illinoinensis]